jgi:Zn-dependent metalloprotease
MAHQHSRNCNCHACCFIVPPYLLTELAKRGEADARDAALHSLELSAILRTERQFTPNIRAMNATVTAGGKRRRVFDAQHTENLPGKLMREEAKAVALKDLAAKEAWDGSGVVYDFYEKVLGRKSIDDLNMGLDSSVHFGVDYQNAFWNGTQMVYGDGDGKIFQRFTRSLDVIGHELTHGVTQYEAGLVYKDQPGALNEHFSDVFGILVKQYKLKQTADKADWIIGAGLFARGINGVGIRSMKAPGTAYDDPRLGKDPQPDHMSNLYTGTRDNGGVHINSGIPNRAFYLAAVELSGNAWDKVGKIWYVALRDRIKAKTNFKQAATMIISVASDLYGQTSPEKKAVESAWKTVGVL